jgi:hypothetical protein
MSRSGAGLFSQQQSEDDQADDVEVKVDKALTWCGPGSVGTEEKSPSFQTRNVAQRSERFGSPLGRNVWNSWRESGVPNHSFRFAALVFGMTEFFDQFQQSWDRSKMISPGRDKFLSFMFDGWSLWPRDLIPPLGTFSMQVGMETGLD